MVAISHSEAREFYNRLGRRLDWQAFYEDPAIEELLAFGGFEGASAVCEFGCGTGRLATRLLSEHLSDSATYAGLDVSETMVKIAKENLAPWSDRASVILTDGSPRIPQPDKAFDRVVTTYVLDLLSDADIRELLIEAGRVLEPDGLLCNVSLTFGQRLPSRAICSLWQKIHAWRPVLLGGCRPMELGGHLDENRWRLKHRAVVCRFGICSEIVVAARNR